MTSLINSQVLYPTFLHIRNLFLFIFLLMHYLHRSGFWQYVLLYIYYHLISLTIFFLCFTRTSFCFFLLWLPSLFQLLFETMLFPYAAMFFLNKTSIFVRCLQCNSNEIQIPTRPTTSNSKKFMSFPLLLSVP